MSFDLDLTAMLQYAYNVFASGSPLLYLYGGGAFALFLLGGFIAVFRRKD